MGSRHGGIEGDGGVNMIKINLMYEINFLVNEF